MAHEEFSQLVQVMNELREKCPWDKEQTHETLLKYLLEETYELVDAIESRDMEAMREELGDLLLQIVFHSRLAQETSSFTIDDVARGISEKLISRHPHVFGDVDASSAEEVERNWEALKAAEKNRSSVIDGIALSQPALSLVNSVIERSAKKGIDLHLEQIAPSAQVDQSAIGKLLVSIVALAQRHGIDPESALREAGKSMIERVRAAEEAAR